MNDDLYKRETCFIIFSTIIALIIIGVSLWLLQQPSCWSKYTTEREAIMHCEGKL